MYNLYKSKYIEHFTDSEFLEFKNKTTQNENNITELNRNIQNKTWLETGQNLQAITNLGILANKLNSTDLLELPSNNVKINNLNINDVLKIKNIDIEDKINKLEQKMNEYSEKMSLTNNNSELITYLNTRFDTKANLIGDNTLTGNLVLNGNLVMKNTSSAIIPKITGDTVFTGNFTAPSASIPKITGDTVFTNNFTAPSASIPKITGDTVFTNNFTTPSARIGRLNIRENRIGNPGFQDLVLEDNKWIYHMDYGTNVYVPGIGFTAGEISANDKVGLLNTFNKMNINTESVSKVNDLAQSALAKAHTGVSDALAAHNLAINGMSKAESAYTLANSGIIEARAAKARADSAYTLANNALPKSGGVMTGHFTAPSAGIGRFNIRNNRIGVPGNQDLFFGDNKWIYSFIYDEQNYIPNIGFAANAVNVADKPVIKSGDKVNNPWHSPWSYNISHM